MKQKNPKVVYICCFPALFLAMVIMLYMILGKNRTDNTIFLYGGLTFILGSLLMYLLVGRRIKAREAEKEESKAVSPVRQQATAPTPGVPEKVPAGDQAASPVRQQEIAPAQTVSEKTLAGDRVDLRKHLTGDEIRILLSDLQVASGKVPEDQKAALDVLAGEISGNGTIHVKTLPICVSAVETGLGVFSAFGLVPAGHSALLDKLKKLQGAE